MKLAEAPNVLLMNPTLVRVPGRLLTPASILADAELDVFDRTRVDEIAMAVDCRVPEIVDAGGIRPDDVGFGCGHSKRAESY